MIPSSSQGRLPTGFKEVEWLQGTGTQYCVTDIYPVNDNSTNFIAVRGNVTVLDKQNSKFTLGTSWGQSSGGIAYTYRYQCKYAYVHQITSQSESYKGLFTIEDARSNSAAHVNFDFTNYVFPVDIHYELNKRNVVVNDASYNKQTMLAYNDTTRPLIIGGTYATGEVSIANTQVRVKSFTVYNVDTLLYEFVPCYRTSDHKTGFMKITVADGSTEFFPNQGTDEWIIGPTV